MLLWKYLLGLMVTITLLGAGCTHTQLRYNTVHQAKTVSDIQQQQVLNNLAKFVYDPNALPDFSWPNAGSSGVQDTGSLGFSLGWIRSGFDSVGLTGGAGRTADEAWTLTPVTDPRKLELMRCAYQRAIASCGIGVEPAHCPHCQKRWAAFYLGTEKPRTQQTVSEEVKKQREKDKPSRKEQETEMEYQTRLKEYEAETDKKIKAESGDLPTDLDDAMHRHTIESGLVTSECLQSPCWFHTGCDECVPKHLHCGLVGHYCGVKVWVLPGEGTDELTKLTLAILDYAVNEPAERRQKEVVVEYKVENGLRVPQKVTEKFQTDAEDSLKIEGLSTEQARTLLNEPEKQGPFFAPTNNVLPPRRLPAPGSALLPFEQSRRALVPF